MGVLPKTAYRRVLRKLAIHHHDNSFPRRSLARYPRHSGRTLHFPRSSSPLDLQPHVGSRLPASASSDVCGDRPWLLLNPTQVVKFGQYCPPTCWRGGGEGEGLRLQQVLDTHFNNTSFTELEPLYSICVLYSAFHSAVIKQVGLVQLSLVPRQLISANIRVGAGWGFINKFTQ